ncbi:hypothetical protein ACFSSB_00420 [Lacinutrix gracilariae]|uniref:Uncharacterized protein n=1 Tax=Lacinutrix gracilariae TaxID=1747198 RepID=A0ABW5JVR2_9FLAO
MKSTATLIIGLFITLSCFAQQGINYKALIKDGGGNVVANDLVAVQFQILKGAGMTEVYQETHTISTDSNGIVIVNIGEGSVDSGVYEDIDWGSDNHYLNVQINTGSDLVDLGTTPFMSVPYSKHATNANMATRITIIPEPYILGRSSITSSARFQFNGKFGWQAAQEMCEASYPNDPNVRAFTLEQITQAIVLGNWDVNNVNSIDGVDFWAITPITYNTLSSTMVLPHQNNAFGLNHNIGATHRGTTGEIIIEANYIPEETIGDNPSNTYLRVNNNVSPGNQYPCMCGTYKN